MPDEENKSFRDSLPADIKVRDRDQRTPAQRVMEEAQRILGPGVRVVLAVDRPDQKPGRIMMLHQAGFRAIRWSELKPKQTKAFEEILPYHRDDFVRFVDTMLMAAREDVYQARVRSKTELREAGMRAKIAAESKEAIKRDLGLTDEEVSDKF